MANEGDGISTRKRNFIEGIARAVEARRESEQDLGFAVRDFVMCGLPYKRQKGTSYVRRNGKVTLEVTGSGRYGLPFGQDRLIPIWLATAFKVMGQPDDNTIRFRCASDIWRAFIDRRRHDDGSHAGGFELRRLRDGIARVFGSTYLVEDHGQGQNLRADSYRLIRRVDLWFHRQQHLNQYTLWQNTVELDSVFADDLRRASVPIDLDGVRALKAIPAALDLYVWQAWRSYRLTIRGQDAEVPVFGEAGLLAQLGTTTENPRKAKQLLRRWQQRVRAAWPECPNEFTP